MCFTGVGRAWKQVSPNTIRNCWVRTGIVPAPLAASLKQQNEPKKEHLLSEVDDLISRLCLDDPMDAASYVTFEDDVATERNENDVEEEQKNDEEGGSEDDECEETVLTHREALRVVMQLSVYASLHNIGDAKLNNLQHYSRTEMQRTFKQSSIRTFFPYVG